MSPIIVASLIFITLMVVWYMYLTKDTTYDPDTNGLHVFHIVVSGLGTAILIIMLLVYPVSKRIDTYEIDDIIKGKTYTSIRLKNGLIINDTRVEIFNADSIIVTQKIDVNTFGQEFGYGYIVKAKEKEK